MINESKSIRNLYKSKLKKEINEKDKDIEKNSAKINSSENNIFISSSLNLFTPSIHKNIKDNNKIIFSNISKIDKNSFKGNPFIFPLNYAKEQNKEKNANLSNMKTNIINKNDYINRDESSNKNNFDIKNIKRSNSKNELTEIEKCHHKRYFISYCTKDSIDKHGFLCYECLFKYHLDHINKCIPIKRKKQVVYFRLEKNQLNIFIIFYPIKIFKA